MCITKCPICTCDYRKLVKWAPKLYRADPWNLEPVVSAPRLTPRLSYFSCISSVPGSHVDIISTSFHIAR
jgi:hypothetical protein